VAGTKLGPYEVQAMIGSGGMGEVYRARDTRLDRTVAVKIIPHALSSDPLRRQRFEREARAISALQHPNICTLYDVGFQDGSDYMVMEYLEGETLAARLQKGRLSFDLTLRYATEVADALDAAHRRGIVHRDLKPANILIDNDALLKIVDFGVAAAQTQGDTQLTKTGYVIGSPKYMAPEQILGKKVDERADIYSLGVILYEMFSGVPPYSRGDHMSVMYQHVQGKAKPPIDINKDLPLELNNLVMKCMSLDKAKRAQTMDELRLSLEKFL
jgi:serine/threonine-protein kinase